MAGYTDREARRAVFHRILPFLGKTVPASFLTKTGEVIPGIPLLHSLAEGIFKPRGSAYALSIASMVKNPYADRIAYNPDRTWFFDYSPKAGSLGSAINTSLFNCLHDKEPVLVLKQLSDKTGPGGARYRLLGLGLVEEFDPANRLFRIRGLQIKEIEDYLGCARIMEDDYIDTAIQLEALEAWRPFEDPHRVLYRISAEKRHEHFRKIVIANYNSACAVTGQHFELGDLVEAEAAHIIPKEMQGTDDPRNGLSMARSVHWAFDAGLFTITDQYEVVIHPSAKSAKVRCFPLFQMDRKVIQLPREDYFYPHAEALEWHRENRYGRFAG